MNYNPSVAATAEDGIFGLGHSYQDSNIIILPAPWDVTTSYGSGTRLGPQAILQASPQLDLFDLELGNAYECGIHMLPEDSKLHDLNLATRSKAELVMTSEHTESLLEEVNSSCAQMLSSNKKRIADILNDGKTAVLLGGDHSTSEAAINAYSEYFKGNFSLLHIDAHMDLRNAYQGFKHSHASVMHNIMSNDVRPKNLVQLGIRDFCQEEYEFGKTHPDIKTYFDETVHTRFLTGNIWSEICREIIDDLDDQVYISCDIDGLTPDLSPNTGTPVVGGVSFHQYLFLLKAIVRSGRKIIGFDLVEVCPEADSDNEWDGNVGARVLYKMCSWAAKSQGLIKSV